MNYEKLTNEQLGKRFSKLTTLTHTVLAQAAMIWMEMRHRGMNLSHYPNSFHRIMPLIALKKLLPEAVLELAGENTKLLLISEFDLPTQKAIISGKELPVVRNNVVEHRPITAISSIEARRVLKGGKIQSPAKQRAELKAVEPRPLPLKKESVAEMRRTTWRQAFKEIWRRGSVEDRKWAAQFTKEFRT